MSRHRPALLRLGRTLITTITDSCQVIQMDHLTIALVMVVKSSTMTPADEIWLPVVGYEGCYEVSNQHRVRTVERVADVFISAYFRQSQVSKIGHLT